jgi:hypothetical protein
VHIELRGKLFNSLRIETQILERLQSVSYRIIYRIIDETALIEIDVLGFQSTSSSISSVSAFVLPAHALEFSRSEEY